MSPRSPLNSLPAMPEPRIRPGDFAAVPMRGAPGFGVALGELADGARGWTGYRHVLGYAGYHRRIPAAWDPRWIASPAGTRSAAGHYVFEAMPGGARFRLLDGRPEAIPGALWSAGRIKVSDTQRSLICAQMPVLQGTPYSAADYFALAAHRLRLARTSGRIQRYVASTGHMICSQLWDAMYAQAGVELFTDKRWPGYVDPYDMACLILGMTRER
jgi:hypothetical protein